MAREPKTRRGWLAYVERHKLQYLGSGVSRTVYALDAGRVLKLEGDYPYNDAHADACRKEGDFYAESDTRARKFLAEVLAYGDGWLIMERAQKTLYDLIYRDRTFNYERGDRLTDKLRTTTGDTLSDLHPGNVGYFGKGVYKLIDYAV